MNNRTASEIAGWLGVLIMVIVFLVALGLIITGISLNMTGPALAEPTNQTRQVWPPLTVIPQPAKNLGEELLQTYLIELASGSPERILYIRPRYAGADKGIINGHITAYSLSFICVNRGEVGDEDSCIRFDDILYVEVGQ